MKSLKERILSHKEEGAALVTAIIVLTAIELLGFALTTMSQLDMSISRNMIKNEETSYAAEQGVLLGIAYVDKNRDSMKVKYQVPICSAQTRGWGSTNYTCGSDAYPQWSDTITWTGIAPPSSGMGPGTKKNTYSVHSKGVGEDGLARFQWAEFSEIAPRCKGYTTCKQKGKLATASY